MKSLHLILLAALALPVAACGKAQPANEAQANETPMTTVQTADAQVTEAEPGLFAMATLSADSATALATANTPGRIVKGELENEDGALIYSFDIAVEGQEGVTEVHVDAKTGAIIKVEHEEGEEAGETGG
jgi:uncharacterized membrane protein YkoI